MITIEIGETPTAENPETSWRCLLYGDILELVEGTESWRAHVETDSSGRSENALVQQGYKAAKGFMFKQINDEGSEATCDIIGELTGARSRRRSRISDSSRGSGEVQRPENEVQSGCITI